LAAARFFNAWGSSDAAEATRLVDICLDAGLTMFDSADVYSNGAAEEILGQAIRSRRDRVLISTKATFRSGADPNAVGSSRFHLTRAVEGSLRRLGTDYIDLFQIHGFDACSTAHFFASNQHRGSSSRTAFTPSANDRSGTTSNVRPSAFAATIRLFDQRLQIRRPRAQPFHSVSRKPGISKYSARRRSSTF
jgi:hypothetical protein